MTCSSSTPAEHFDKGKRQNRLLHRAHREDHLDLPVPNEEPRYSRRVPMEEIERNDFNLNISRYISTASAEEEIDLDAVNAKLASLEQRIEVATNKHNEFLKELGLPLLPSRLRRRIAFPKTKKSSFFVDSTPVNYWLKVAACRANAIAQSITASPGRLMIGTWGSIVDNCASHQSAAARMSAIRSRCLPSTR